jgi:ATP-dependent Lon protease
MKGQSHQSPDSTVSPSSSPSSPDHFIEHVLSFVGRLGTGKTSLSQSFTRDLGRPFQRIALGGARDEAEIRGHGRTYAASGPGLLAQVLGRAGRIDPVLLL